MKANQEQKGVAEEDALRKLLNSESEDEEEEEEKKKEVGIQCYIQKKNPVVNFRTRHPAMKMKRIKKRVKRNAVIKPKRML